MPASATQTSREFTALLIAKNSYRPWQKTHQAAIGVTKDLLIQRMQRWDAGVNSQLALFDLLGDLSFSRIDEDTLVLSVDGKPALSLKRPSLDQYRTQLQDVLDWAPLRADRASEILAQTTDMGAFFQSVLPLSAEKNASTLLLLKIATQLSSYIVLRFKHEFGCPRPVELSPQIQPMIPTPMHGAYPMGHMSEAVIVANLLSKLTHQTGSPAWNEMTEQLKRIAIRIGQNRIVAGVHYPIDLHTCDLEYGR